jgi:hypothetical protein
MASLSHGRPTAAHATVQLSPRSPRIHVEGGSEGGGEGGGGLGGGDGGSEGNAGGENGNGGMGGGDGGGEGGGSDGDSAVRQQTSRSWWLVRL